MTQDYATVEPPHSSLYTQSHPPASWSAVVALGIGAFTLVTAEFLPVGLLLQIARDLKVTEGQAGLMVTIPGFIAAFSAFLTISLARRFDRRYVLWFLLSLLVVSNTIIAFAGNLPILLFGRILLGIAIGGFWTIGVSLGPRLRPDAMGKATSIIFSGVTMGTVLGVPLGTLLGNLLGWRSAFGAFSILVLMVVAALVKLLPTLQPEKSLGLAQIPSVLKLRKVQVGLIAVIFIFIGQFSAYTYISPFLFQVSGVSSNVLSGVLLAYGVSGIFGNIFCGWLVERNVRFGVLVATLLLGAAQVLLLLTPNHDSLAVMEMVIWGFGFGMLPIALQSWIFKAAPEQLESVAALFVSLSQLAVAVGALVGGAVVDLYGIQCALWVGGCCIACAAVWIFITFPHK